MDDADAIPVVELEDMKSKDTLDAIHKAFCGIGFVFIKHPLITQQKIDTAFSVSRDFFQLPLQTKSQYLRTSNTDNSGYVGLQQERLEPSRPPDLKECFNIPKMKSFSVREIEPFEETFKRLYETLLEIAKDLLKMMGQSLKLKDPHFFEKCHTNAGKGTDYSFTTMRLLYYPAVDPATVQPGQIRCGEHVDYGSITLLFQDKNGGLQVKTTQGVYLDVPYIEGAILVNLGALMQQWTCDKYLATPHRVLIPSDEKTRGRVRQSLAFFVHPDNDTIVECIDGSNKYPPITAAEDIAQRFAKTFLNINNNN